jgi:uncharacterized protein
MAESVASVSSWEVKSGHEEEFEHLGEEVMAAASRVHGHLSGTTLHEDGSTEYHFVHSFAGHSELQRWLDSPERADLLERVSAIAERKGEPQRITGLEGWFAEAGSKPPAIVPPPRWKMWLASFLGAYPLVVLFQWLAAPELEDVPLLLRAALLPLVLLSLMTYLVMPVVTKLLKRWLYPGSS